MEFGKSNHLDQVDFSFPETSLQNKKILNKIQRREKSTVYLGTTGWGNPEWAGVYYPSKNPKTFLESYGQQFSTIELNTSFYRIPPIEQLQKWYQTTPADFKFCPKVYKPISHNGFSAKTFLLMDNFIQVFQTLKEKLGPSFIQFPEYWTADHLPQLVNFLNKYHGQMDLAVELRHPSWFDDSSIISTLTDLFSSMKTTWLMTDVAGRRDVLHMLLTSSKAMIRFVGNELHPTDYYRIDNWIEKILFWLEQGIQEVYFFVHQPSILKSPELMTILEKEIKASTDVEIRGPKRVNHGADQMTLF
jgi:uncharacterized protein YecE (DUF72 family)